MQGKTITFSLHNGKELDAKKILLLVHKALSESGYNPVNQISGYILSGDPTYITTHNNARNLIQQLDRYELLKILIGDYINSK